MSDMHPIRSLSEAKDFIKRTNLVIDVYSGQLDWLERQAAEEIYAPEFVYAHLIKQLNELINYPIEEHPLYTQFIKKAELLDISDDELAILDTDLKSSIEKSVTPGFVLLRNFMDDGYVNKGSLQTLAKMLSKDTLSDIDRDYAEIVKKAILSCDFGLSRTPKHWWRS